MQVTYCKHILKKRFVPTYPVKHYLIISDDNKESRFPTFFLFLQFFLRHYDQLSLTLFS